MADLATLLRADFEPHVDDLFALERAGAEPLGLRLVEVNGKPAPNDTRRAPFSIVFRGPPEPLLEQAIRRLEHPVLGELALFLVPIGPDEHGMLYEAVFA